MAEVSSVAESPTPTQKPVLLLVAAAAMVAVLVFGLAAFLDSPESEGAAADPSTGAAPLEAVAPVNQTDAPDPLHVTIAVAELSATSDNTAPLNLVAWVQSEGTGVLLNGTDMRFKSYEPAGVCDARADLMSQGLGPDLGRHEFVVRYYGLGDRLCDWDAGGYAVYGWFGSLDRTGTAFAAWDIA